MCLRNDDLDFKLVSIVPEKLPAASLGPLGVDTAPNLPEWAMVVKREKRVPLPDFFPSSLLSFSENGWV